MPAKFTRCAKSKGSRVRTKSLGGGKYIKICFPKKGKSVAGHVAKKKGK